MTHLRQIKLMSALLGLVCVLAGCAAPVRVTWTTETEMNTAGFNLYRATAPDGPFTEKVNAELIPPSADPLTGKEYSYVDMAAQPGVTYYYQLQEIERDGAVNTFGPISTRAGGLGGTQVALLAGLLVIVVVLWLGAGRIWQRARSSR